MNVSAPRHCPPANDCRDWAFDQREAANDVAHDEELHASRALMDIRFGTWLADSIRAVQGTSTLARLKLPNPNWPGHLIEHGIIDATTVHVLLAFARRSGQDASGFYAGLVGQEPSGVWRGLSGFYLAACPGCLTDLTRLTALFTSVLSEAGLAARGRSAIPLPLRSSLEWFDNDRIELCARVCATGSLSPYWTPMPESVPATSALVTLGPCLDSTTAMILVPSLRAAVEELSQMGEEPAGWTVRFGGQRALRTLSGLPTADRAPLTAEVRRRNDRRPRGWARAAVRLGDQCVLRYGPRRDVWAEISVDIDRVEECGSRVEVIDLRYLPDTGPVTLGEVAAL